METLVKQLSRHNMFVMWTHDDKPILSARVAPVWPKSGLSNRIYTNYTAIMMRGVANHTWNA